MFSFLPVIAIDHANMAFVRSKTARAYESKAHGFIEAMGVGVV